MWGAVVNRDGELCAYATSTADPDDVWPGSQAIAKAKAWREIVTVIADDGAEAYAYQKPEGRIAWGVNAPGTGVNVLRGIRRPDGSDEAVT